jgi:hypothetical protein
VLLHAARLPDRRPLAWRSLPAELSDAAGQLGGIVGAGLLVDCKPYRSARSFRADRRRHLNAPAWFEQPGLFGFVFAELRVRPFKPCPGAVRFFTIEDDEDDGLAGQRARRGGGPPGPGGRRRPH